MSGVVARGKRVLARMMRELLHGGGCPIVVQRGEESQSTLGGGRVRCRVELVLPSQEEISSRVSRVMAHVVAHVRRHVRRWMGMMRRVSLGVEVVMLLRRCLAGRRLHASPAVRGSSSGTAATGRQFDAQVGQVVRVRGHTVQESVHHRDRSWCILYQSVIITRHADARTCLFRGDPRYPPATAPRLGDDC